MLEEEKRFVSPLNDTTFKFLWKKEESRKWFTKLIKYITEVDLEEYDLYDPELNSGNKRKDYRLDILFIKKGSNHSMNVEMYNSNKDVDRIKSNQYAFKLLGERMKEGEEYKEHELIQVNFYNGLFPENKKADIIYYQIRDESGEYVKHYLKVYDVYLSKHKGKCYNNSNELDAMLSFLTGNSYEELRRIANGNEEALNIVKDLEDLAMEEKYWGVYNIQKDNIMTQNAMYDEGREIGREEGRDIGRGERNVEIAKAMLKDGADISLVEKYTGLSKEEISKWQ